MTPPLFDSVLLLHLFPKPTHSGGNETYAVDRTQQVIRISGPGDTNGLIEFLKSLRNFLVMD
jgi:hypothetical protein